MKLSQYYLPTLREAPADARTEAHKWMLRSGMAREVGVGLYSLLPYGLALSEAIEKRLEDEFFEGGLPVALCALQPRAMWERSGRWDSYGSAMYKVADRTNRQAVLAPESEEAFMSFVDGELKSYKQLPLFLYEKANRYSDVQKPAAGLADGRGVRVVDGIRFDGDEEAAQAFFEEAKSRAEKILNELGIDYCVVDRGDYLIYYATAENYKDAVALDGDAAFLMDEAPIRYPVPEGQEPKEAEDIHTPDARTIKELSDMIGVEPARCTKAVDLRVDGKPVFVFVPGDRDLNQKKLEKYLGVSADQIDMLDEETILEMGTFPGFTGPVGLGEKARIIVDRSVTFIDNMVVGANKEDYHKKNVNYGRDFEGEIAEDLLDVREGDLSPSGNAYEFTTAFEVARIRKPSTAFSEAMNVRFLNDEGKEAPYILGGATWRTGAVLAALLENHRDDDGPAFPLHIGPFDVALTVVNVKKEEQVELADELYNALRDEGISVLCDDRNERAGVKFKDRDLLGIPLQLTVGKEAAEGVVEFKRRGGDMEKLPAEDALRRIVDQINE